MRRKLCLLFNKRVETLGDTSSVDIGSFSISKLDSNRLSTSLSLEDDYIVLMERTELGMTLCDVKSNGPNELNGEDRPDILKTTTR